MRRIADGFLFAVGVMLAISSVKTLNSALVDFAKRAEETDGKDEYDVKITYRIMTED